MKDGSKYQTLFAFPRVEPGMNLGFLTVEKPGGIFPIEKPPQVFQGSYPIDLWGAIETVLCGHFE
jgi:hypothetical protein